MKKLFYVATLAVALTLTACGNEVSKLPNDLREQVEAREERVQQEYQEFRASQECKDMQEEGMDIEYLGVSIEGKNIVYTNKYSISGQFAEEFTFDELVKIYEPQISFENFDVDMREALVENEYNVIVRILGNNGEKYEAVLEYKDLPEYKTRNRSNLKY